METVWINLFGLGPIVAMTCWLIVRYVLFAKSGTTGWRIVMRCILIFALAIWLIRYLVTEGQILG